MTLKIFLQMLVFFVYIFLCSPKLNYQKFTIILINIWTITGGIFRSILFEPIFGKNSLQFLQFLKRSLVISRMVYMDSAIFGFCIRKAIGGARDEVWQYATL